MDLSNLDNLMKEAKKMQENLQKKQEELLNLEVVGKAGGNLVEIRKDGRHYAKKVLISASLVKDEDDRNMLEDLIVAAINDAVRQIEAFSQKMISQFTAGFNLPANFDFNKDKDEK